MKIKFWLLAFVITFADAQTPLPQIVDSSGVLVSKNPAGYKFGLNNLVGNQLIFGGTNAALTASNGGIIWSNASQFQILAGTATANKALLSGATATPTWSSVAVGSMMFADSVSYSKACYIDSAAFTTTALRLAIYAPGNTVNGIWSVTPRIKSDTTPNASDVQLTAYSKVDSVIVHRIASGTSGLGVSLVGRKK